MAERLAASRIPRRLALGAQPDQVEHQRGILATRTLAYAIDSIILGIVSTAFVGVGAAYLLLNTDSGGRDVPDSALWAFVYCSLASVPATAIINYGLLVKRGQTLGHYIFGLKALREDGGTAGPARMLLYMLALHPLVFHPMLASFWALLAYIALSLTSNNALVLASLGVAILCLVGPFIALLAAGPSGGHRALHDRIAGVMVVRLE
jgi:uncharacterized RDD family membrane protein YckC